MSSIGSNSGSSSSSHSNNNRPRISEPVFDEIESSHALVPEEAHPSLANNISNIPLSTATINNVVTAANSAANYINPWLLSAASYLAPVGKVFNTAISYGQTGLKKTGDGASYLASSSKSLLSSGVSGAINIGVSQVFKYLASVTAKDRELLEKLTDSKEIFVWTKAVTEFLPDELKAEDKQNIGIHLFTCLVKVVAAYEIKYNQKVSTGELITRVLSRITETMQDVYLKVDAQAAANSQFPTREFFESDANFIVKEWFPEAFNVPVIGGFLTSKIASYVTDFLHDVYVAHHAPSRRPNLGECHDEIVAATSALVENNITKFKKSFSKEQLQEFLSDHLFHTATESNPSLLPSLVSDSSVQELFDFSQSQLPLLDASKDNIVEFLLRRLSSLSETCGGKEATIDEKFSNFVGAFKNSENQPEVLAHFMLRGMEGERRLPLCLRNPLSKQLNKLLIKPKIFEKIKPWIDFLVIEEGSIDVDPLEKFGIREDAQRFVDHVVESNFNAIQEFLPDSLKGVVQPTIGKFISKKLILHVLSNYAKAKKVEKENFSAFLKQLVDEVLEELNGCLLKADGASEDGRVIAYNALTMTLVQKFIPGLGSLGELLAKKSESFFENLWSMTKPFEKKPLIEELAFKFDSDKKEVVESFCVTLNTIFEKKFNEAFSAKRSDPLMGDRRDLIDPIVISDDVSLTLTLPDSLIVRVKSCLNENTLKTILAYLKDAELEGFFNNDPSIIKAILKKKLPELLDVLPFRGLAAAEIGGDKSYLTKKLSKPERWKPFSQALLKEIHEDMPLRSLLVNYFMPKVLAKNGLLIWECVSAFDLDYRSLVNEPSIAPTLKHEIRQFAQEIATKIKDLVVDAHAKVDTYNNAREALEKSTKTTQAQIDELEANKPLPKVNKLALIDPLFAEAASAFLVEHHIAKYIISSKSDCQSLDVLLKEMIENLVVIPLSKDPQGSFISKEIVKQLFPGLQTLVPILDELIKPYIDSFLADDVEDEKQTLRELLWNPEKYIKADTPFSLKSPIEERISVAVGFETNITSFEKIAGKLSSFIIDLCRKELVPFKEQLNNSLIEEGEDDDSSDSDSSSTSSVSSSFSSSSSSSVPFEGAVEFANLTVDDPIFSPRDPDLFETLSKKVASQLLNSSTPEMKLGGLKIEMVLQKLILQAMCNMISSAQVFHPKISETELAGEIIKQMTQLFMKFAPNPENGDKAEAWILFSTKLKEWVFPDTKGLLPLPQEQANLLLNLVITKALPKYFAECHASTYKFIKKADANKTVLNDLLKSNHASVFAEMLVKVWLRDFIPDILKKENNKIATLAIRELNGLFDLRLGRVETNWFAASLVNVVSDYKISSDTKSEITVLIEWVSQYNEGLLLHFLANVFSSINEKDRFLRSTNQGTILTYFVEILVPVFGTFYNELKQIKKDTSQKHVSNVPKEELLSRLKAAYHKLAEKPNSKTKVFNEEFCLDEGDLDDKRIQYFLGQSAQLLDAANLDVESIPAPSFLRDTIYNFLKTDAIARMFALSDKMIIENTNNILLQLFTKMRKAIRSIEIDDQPVVPLREFSREDTERRNEFDKLLGEIMRNLTGELPSRKALPLKILEIEKFRNLTDAQLGEMIRKAMLGVDIFNEIKPLLQDVVALLVDGKVEVNESNNLVVKPPKVVQVKADKMGDELEVEAKTEPLKWRKPTEDPKAQENKKKVLDDLRHNGQEAFMEGIEQGLFLRFIRRHRDRIERAVGRFFSRIKGGPIFKSVIKVLEKAYEFIIYKIAVPFIVAVFYIPYQLFVRLPMKLYFRLQINNYVKELKSNYHEANYLRTLSELLAEIIRECDAYRKKD